MLLRFLPAIFVITACSLLPDGNRGRAHYFLTQVKPVLQQHCLQCHNGSLPPPALNLTARATAFTRSAGGREYIRPRAPDRSLLISAVQRGGTHPKMMPLTEVSLTMIRSACCVNGSKMERIGRRAEGALCGRRRMPKIPERTKIPRLAAKRVAAPSRHMHHR